MCHSCYRCYIICDKYAHSFCWKAITKITWSSYLGIWANHKYDESVQISNELASLCFKSVGKAHECHKYSVFIGNAYWLQAMCYQLMRTSPKLYVGKYYQHTRTPECRSMQEMQHADGVCALESSSWHKYGAYVQASISAIFDHRQRSGLVLFVNSWFKTEF